MNVIVLGRTYFEHTEYDKYAPKTMIDLFRIPAKSTVFFYDYSENKRQNNIKSSDGVHYRDIVGSFENIHSILSKHDVSKLDMVFMDYSTFKFVNHLKSKNIFALLFKHDFIKNSTIFHLRDLRPKNYKPDCFKFKKSYVNSYTKKLNPDESFVLLINDLQGKKHSVRVNKDHTMREIKAILHYNHDVKKIDLFTMIFAGERLADERSVQDYKLYSGTTLHLAQTLCGFEHMSKAANATHRIFEKNGYTCTPLKEKEPVLLHMSAPFVKIGDHKCIFNHNTTKNKQITQKTTKPLIKTQKRFVGQACAQNMDCKNNNCVDKKCVRKKKINLNKQ